MEKYNPKDIESKWQEYWGKHKTFEVKEDPTKKKFYGLVEFPYPSGAGLHVGHPRSYTAMDVIARKRRMEGYTVLYPMGFDSFGLPTENFAIKTGRPPSEITKENINTFTRQLKALGFSFDWSRAVTTSEPEYYKWTQWIFLQLYKHGLAYKKKQPINWCPKDKIGLANEEVVDGKCERCGGSVEKRDKEQWMLAITKYADKLLEGLNEVDYIERAKLQQQNWIGRSEGATVKFIVHSSEFGVLNEIEVFTTRPDTIFGVTFLAVGPELAKKWIDSGWNASPAIHKYIEVTLHERMTAGREEQEKTGIDAGFVAVNPANGEEIPVWVANYVMGDVGTGAIMAVPAHDERDFEFAKKYGLPVENVIRPYPISAPVVTVKPISEPFDITKAINEREERILNGEEVYSGDGILVNSSFLNGLQTKEAKAKMIAWLEEKGIGQRKVQYKLRDWVFSRQRYWGEPIPLVHCGNCASKKQRALIIHGFEGSGDGNWFPWTKKQLEAQGFEVFAPSISTAAHPTVDSWVDELLPIVKDFGEEDIIIGHSLGSKAALHLLEKSKKKIKHLYLVASAIGEMMERDWDLYRREWKGSDVDSLKNFWETPVSFEKIGKHAGQVTVILSDDDPWIKKKTHENLPASWVFHLWHGYQHFSMAQSPELLNVFLKSKNTGWIPLPEKELPLKLPEVKNYQPTDTGESPLSTMADWVNTKCPNCGGPARRETDTMPNWAGSSWYFLRYCDPNNKKEFASMEKLKYWMQVDWYNGGMEHTVLHLLYSRFWNQFLYDIGVVPTLEPYKKRTSHGMILASDGQKMSKSLGNVINPDDMVREYGADALRTYIMFMGPFDQMIAWDTNGLIGVRRFLERVWFLQTKAVETPLMASLHEGENETLLHQTIKKVTEDIEGMRFNTAVAKMMELTNELNKQEHISRIDYRTLLKLLSPFAPHLCEEAWSLTGGKGSLAFEPWPTFDPSKIVSATMTIAVQVNGKLRDTLTVPADISEEEAKQLALASEKVQKWLAGKEPKKVICVKGKLVSIVSS